MIQNRLVRLIVAPPVCCRLTPPQIRSYKSTTSSTQFSTAMNPSRMETTLLHQTRFRQSYQELVQVREPKTISLSLISTTLLLRTQRQVDPQSTISKVYLDPPLPRQRLYRNRSNLPKHPSPSNQILHSHSSLKPLSNPTFPSSLRPLSPMPLQVCG